MKKCLSFTVVALLLFSNDSSLNAAPFDTGMITLQQPDRTEFTGRIWGDEFSFSGQKQKMATVSFNPAMVGTIMHN